MISPSFAHMLNVSAEVRRAPPTTAQGKRGLPVDLAPISVTPLDPLNHEAIIRYGVEAPTRLRVCYVAADADVRAGDALVVNAREYNVRNCSDWSAPTGVKELILEDMLNA